MIRLVIILIFSFIILEAKNDVDNKIKNTSTKINSFGKNYSTINKRMADTAKAILSQKKKIATQQSYLKKLKAELGQKESSYKSNTTQLKGMKEAQSKLKKNQGKIEDELLLVISQSVSLSVILETQNSVNAESLIEFEVLQAMLKDSKKKANKLNTKFYDNSKSIDTLNAHASSLEVAILNIDKKRKSLISIQKANKKALKKLTIAKASYKKKLKKILQKQDTLKKTLATLNIIKIDERKKAKEEKERKIAFNAKKKVVSNKNLPKVKKHGSSYQAIKTKRYKGKKTIAPLDSYTITKKYGTYTDPIYGIKIFNESISLKPKKANAKVKTVFNGKVIYANKTAVLDNIVIVEHSGGLHTIYANLSRINPKIKKGKKIKKGYTIGRVSDELMFEVTQKSYHINPIRLFQ